jgi:2-amino-4-hydroxy-6-hydroxymethyldihydropteridine diphosphokinase
MSVTRAALGLGSNLGDRVAYLESAIATIAAAPGVSVVGVSPFVESTAVGGPDQPDYINAVVVIDTSLNAGALLALAQRCETDAQRVRHERWGPRTLDVDVLAYGAETRDDPQLTLPHPLATQRAFVMVPWATVDPDFVVAGRSVAEWARQLDDHSLRSATDGSTDASH